MPNKNQNVTIKKLAKGDLTEFIELIHMFKDVFAMQDFIVPSHDHLKKMLEKEDFIVFVAKMNDKVVGGLTVYVLAQYYSLKALAYIFDLAVARRHQRRGIGTELINAVNRFCKASGFEEVFVQADKIDTYALDFYRSTRPS
jgi:aminoglycoside 3-N-acetyltransferase I